MEKTPVSSEKANMNGTCTSLRQAWSGRDLGQGEGVRYVGSAKECLYAYISKKRVGKVGDGSATGSFRENIHPHPPTWSFLAVREACPSFWMSTSLPRIGEIKYPLSERSPTREDSVLRSIAHSGVHE